MSYTAEQLLVLASNFDKLADESLVKEAKKKEEDGKKPGKKKPFPFWLKKKGPKGSEKDSKKSDTNSAKDSKDSSKKDKKDKKKKSAYYDTILSKLAQTKDMVSSQFGSEKDKARSVSQTPMSRVKQMWDTPTNSWSNIPSNSEMPPGIIFRTLINNKWNYGEVDSSGQYIVKDPLELSQITGVEIDKFPTAPPGGSKYPPIDKTFQAMLGVSADGSLGPATQKALDLYKKSIGQEDWASNSLLFESLKNEPSYMNKSQLPKDPHSGLYISEASGPHTNPAGLPDPFAK